MTADPGNGSESVFSRTNFRIYSAAVCVGGELLGAIHDYGNCDAFQSTLIKKVYSVI